MRRPLPSKAAAFHGGGCVRSTGVSDQSSVISFQAKAHRFESARCGGIGLRVDLAIPQHLADSKLRAFS